MSLVQQIKDEWKDTFKAFSYDHQNWAANQMITELKENGEINEANRLIMATNAEIAEWLAA